MLWKSTDEYVIFPIDPYKYVPVALMEIYYIHVCIILVWYDQNL